MSHFAIPDGDFSPAEAKLASTFGSDAVPFDTFAPIGLALVARDIAFAAGLLAVATGLDVGGRRTSRER